MSDYNVVFTHAAQVDLLRYGGVEAVEAVVRAEIDEIIDESGGNISGIIFHTVSIGSDGLELFCTPTKDGNLLVDACLRDTQTIDKGPMAGKRIMFPKAFSED